VKISIAMTTYNGARFLREQLDSLAAQTRRPDELVITDDQSDDETIAIAREFGETSLFPVRIERNPRRLGITSNFSRVLSLCSGDLVMLSDQDDAWLPHKIETIEATAKRNPAHACFVNDALLADKDLRPSGATKRGQILASGMSPSTMVMGCCTTFRRELLPIVLPIPDDPQGFDGWLVHFSDLLGTTLRIDTPLQLYRRHGNNASNIFVNRLEPLSRVDVVRKRIRDLPAKLASGTALDSEVEFYSLAVARMTVRMQEIGDLLGPERALAALSSTKTRTALLMRRQAIREQPLWRRPTMVLGLLLGGGYRSSGRAIGAAKDLFFTRADSSRQPR
jgi:glycosyltransferase involved in cell wall biosynthesis